jgi:excisionase family DNA binding protein
MPEAAPIDDDTMLTLDEAARRMFPTGGVTSDTLKRNVRKGTLRAYRIGRSYQTTMRDMRDMAKDSIVSKYMPRKDSIGLVNVELASQALDEALRAARLKRKRK